MIIDDDYSVSTERVSDEYLTLNSCGIQRLGVIDRGSRRVNGRLDYHILYIEQGCCHLTLEGQETCVGAGGVILFRPREPQIYSFRAADDSVSHYIHFTGSGCAELLGGSVYPTCACSTWAQAEAMRRFRLKWRANIR